MTTREKAQPSRMAIPLVYFITDGTAIKIGFTNNINNRLSDIQVGNPRKLRLLGYIPCRTEQEGKMLEQKWHDCLFFGKCLPDIPRNEWYDALDVLEVLSEETDTKCKYLCVQKFRQDAYPLGKTEDFLGFETLVSSIGDFDKVLFAKALKLMADNIYKGIVEEINDDNRRSYEVL